MKFEEMIESFLKNDNRAFEHIFHTCSTYCINTLISKRNCRLDDAEDIFVDAILIFRRKILKREIEYLTNLKTYLYKICENNYLAKLKKESAVENKAIDVAEFLYDNSQEVDPQLARAASYSWRQLSEKCKDIIYLFYVESIRMEEIAKLLGLANADTAKSTKSRCYQKLVAVAKGHFNQSEDES